MMPRMPKPHTDLLPDLPLFPLGTVVFDGALLPLQIFEPRYLHMVRACERAQTPFGVVTLTRGREVRGPQDDAEQFAPIGSLMELVRVDSPQAGLLHIWCRAMGHLRVGQARQQADGLWRADAQCLPAPPAVPVPEHLAHLREPMHEALERLGRQALPAIPWPEPWLLDDCHWLSSRWGELIPLPLDEKYRLFVLDDPLLRLELIGDLLASSGQASAAS